MGISSSPTLGSGFAKKNYPDTETPTIWTRLSGFVFFIVSLSITVFLIGVLTTYNKLDSGFSHVTSAVEVQNIFGVPGAWTADFLFLLFGWGAWIILGGAVGILIHSWKAMINSEIVNGISNGIRLFAFCLLICSVCTLFFLRFHSYSGNLPGTSGGALGSAIGTELLYWTGLNWSTLICVVLVALGTSLYFGFSWLSLIESIGGFSERLVSKLKRSREEFEDNQAGLEERKLRKQKLDEQKDKEEDPEAPRDFNKPIPFIPERRDPTSVVTISDEPLSLSTEEKRLINPDAEPDEEEELEPEQTESEWKEVAQAEEGEDVGDEYVLPDVSLLESPPFNSSAVDQTELRITAERIEHILQSYRIKAKVVSWMPGPIVTLFKVQPGPGVQSSRFTKISKDLARGLGQPSIRVLENLREVDCLGLEIPNTSSSMQTIYLKEIIGSETFKQKKSHLSLAMGKNISGEPVVLDLAKAPHLLVAGTTGSGKSVGINTMILSMLYKNTPDELRLILIDPKEVEFAPYENIPHLLTPVITDMTKAANALDWAVKEMDKRYKLMKSINVRNFDDFNEKLARAKEAGDFLPDPFTLDKENPDPLKKFSYIVIIIDELADLLMTHGKQVETLIMRLTQKARAAGIHLVLATQRPSTDIVTPIIKTNCPSRISFQVSNRYDSQTILNEAGAEELLGRGDMFFMTPARPLQRIHGAFVMDKEIEAVTDFIKEQREPNYLDGVTDSCDDEEDADDTPAKAPGGETDAFYDQAVSIVVNDGKASISYLQRKLSIGYNRAAKLIEAMEEAGIVSAPTATGKRSILVNKNEY